MSDWYARRLLVAVLREMCAALNVLDNEAASDPKDLKRRPRP